MEDNDDDHDKGLWLPGKKRPNKGRSHTRGLSSNQPNKHTGITKLNPRPIPAPVNNFPDYTATEPIRNMFIATSETHGTVGTGVHKSRLVSPWIVTPWKKEYIDPNKSQPYIQSRQPSHLRQSRQSRQPSHLRQPSHSKSLGQGGRRTHKHKRKNKHTRRRRVQRRRA